MNREIKFRVWDKKKKKFLKPTNRIKITLDGQVTQAGKWAYAVDKKCIIQQFTGLEDKDGQDIYEGDIVSVKLYNDWNDDVAYDVIHLVQWCDVHVGFRGFTKNMIESKSKMSGAGLPNPITVLGNYCENPELLK